jgi:hypothetical protein
MGVSHMNGSAFVSDVDDANAFSVDPHPYRHDVAAAQTENAVYAARLEKSGDLTHLFKNNRPDPPFVLGDRFNPKFGAYDNVSILLIIPRELKKTRFKRYQQVGVV